MFDTRTTQRQVELCPDLMSTMEHHLAQALAEVEALAEPDLTPESTELVSALERDLLRTRALLAGTVTDRDDATARLDAAQSRLKAAVDDAETAAAVGRGLRHRLTMAEADVVRARGERDLARVELDAARATSAGGDASDLPTRLAEQPPGPALAQALAAVVGDLAVDPGSPATTGLGCLDGLSDDEVVTVVTAAQRLATWAGAVQMHAAGQLRERWAPPPMGGDDEAQWITACEIALATGTTRHAAAAQLAAARHLPSRMPGVYRLFAQGRLATAKAMLIADKTSDLPPEAVTAIETVLLDPATDLPEQITGPMTRGQLASLLDRLIAAACPDQATARAREARARRGVTFQPLPDGMGQMTLTTTAEIIEAVRAALNTITLAARGRGRLDDPENYRAPCDPDGRHPAAVRADVLTDIIIGAAEDSTSDTPTDDTPTDRDPPDDDDPAGADDRHQADDTNSEVPDEAPNADAGAAFRPPVPRETTCPSARPSSRRRAEIVVLIPLSVLTGQSQAPATLAGYGPIPAQLARELAATGVWRCAAVDDREGSPSHGTLLGLGRSTHTPAYSPGPGLRQFVEIRDGTCQFPGCRQTAGRSDIDHRIPWTGDRPGDQSEDPPGGARGDTCDCNNHALCRHHHLLKHSGRLSVRAHPGGGSTWTTPTGRTYTRTPDPLV